MWRLENESLFARLIAASRAASLCMRETTEPPPRFNFSVRHGMHPDGEPGARKDKAKALRRYFES